MLNVQAKSDHNDDDCSSKDSNIIVGTRPFTLGTKCNGVIVACYASATDLGLPTCGNGDIVRGFKKNDVIQGSVGNDELYGDEGNDRFFGNLRKRQNLWWTRY